MEKNRTYLMVLQEIIAGNRKELYRAETVIVFRKSYFSLSEYPVV